MDDVTGNMFTFGFVQMFVTLFRINASESLEKKT